MSLPRPTPHSAPSKRTLAAAIVWRCTRCGAVRHAIGSGSASNAHGAATSTRSAASKLGASAADRAVEEADEDDEDEDDVDADGAMASREPCALALPPVGVGTEAGMPSVACASAS